MQATRILFGLLCTAGVALPAVGCGSDGTDNSPAIRVGAGGTEGVAGAGGSGAVGGHGGSNGNGNGNGGGTAGVGGVPGTGGTDGGVGGAAGGPPFIEDCDNGPLDQPIANCQPESPEPTGDPYADCVTRINQLRWECQCLPPLQRWSAAESCADQHAEYDSTRSAHAGFRDKICSPGGWAQNECPSWRSTEHVITGCLQAMWDEGPGEPYSEHGHYINMTNPSYSMVACGFYETSAGRFWSVQNFQ